MKTIFPSLCAIAAIAAGLGVTAAQASPALSDGAGLFKDSALVQKADWDDREHHGWWWRRDRDRNDRRWYREDRDERRGDRDDRWHHRDRDDRRDWR
jgi:hypothetical protein